MDTMREENRLDFMIPDNTLVETGYEVAWAGLKASPGDMIVDNINNAHGSVFLAKGYLTDIPGYMPFKGLMAKWFEARGYKTEKVYLVCITNEGLIVYSGGMIQVNGKLVTMSGGQVHRVVVRYHDFRVRYCDISEFLRRFLI